MEFIEHKKNGVSVVEVLEDGVVLRNAQDLLDMISDFACKHLMLRKEQVTKAFFDLSTGLAGEILQKASNYRIFIAFIGDFSAVESRSLRDFIYECNEERQIIFKPTIEDALKVFCRKRSH